MGRAKKSQMASELSWLFYNTLRRVAREEGIAPTLQGIAEQLNRQGLRTNRGNLFDFRKVGAALDQMGVDRVAIRRWKRHAEERAVEWEVPPKELYRQLWFEWQRHVVLHRKPFVPHLVHPSEWVHPSERGEPNDYRFMHPPPQARLAHLFFGAFDEE